MKTGFQQCCCPLVLFCFFCLRLIEFFCIGILVIFIKFQLHIYYLLRHVICTTLARRYSGFHLHVWFTLPFWLSQVLFGVLSVSLALVSIASILVSASSSKINIIYYVMCDLSHPYIDFQKSKGWGDISVKCLLCKHRDQSSNTQEPHKSWTQ